MNTKFCSLLLTSVLLAGIPLTASAKAKKVSCGDEAFWNYGRGKTFSFGLPKDWSYLKIGSQINNEKFATLPQDTQELVNIVCNKNKEFCAIDPSETIILSGESNIYGIDQSIRSINDDDEWKQRNDVFMEQNKDVMVPGTGAILKNSCVYGTKREVLVSARLKAVPEWRAFEYGTYTQYFTALMGCYVKGKNDKEPEICREAAKRVTVTGPDMEQPEGLSMLPMGSLGLRTLAVLYQGRDVTASDFQIVNHEIAFNLNLVLAKNGYAPAMADVADALFNGQGINQDIEAAIYWYTAGAQNGSGPCMLKLFTLLQEGAHIAKDDAKAREYLEKSLSAEYPLSAADRARVEALLNADAQTDNG